MKKVSANHYALFKIILFSYLFPKSKKKFWQKIQEVYLSNIMKCIALSCLLLTILIWMGINAGLKEAYRAFKQDPYTTAVFVTSNRFKLNKDQVERIEITRFDSGKKTFNTEGTGEEIYDDVPFPFSSLDLTFYARDGKERKSFQGRTVSRADKKMLRAIGQHIKYQSNPGYDLERDWQDTERGIIVSQHLLDRLGYQMGKTRSINRCIDKRFQGENRSFPVPIPIIAAAERLPFGDFIISEEYDYNRLQNTFNPFDTVERFYVFSPPGKEQDLEKFVKANFKCVEKIVEINREPDNQIRYEIAFKSIPKYKEEFKTLRQESAKYFIALRFADSPFRCPMDYYDWKTLPEEKKDRDPEYLALYLKEQYIDRLDQLRLFFRETIGGIEMDDTVMNIFENYHKDMRRFKRISIILYSVLVGLGIFVSIAIYIKSVQATMHRLGVFSAFGVSASFLSLALAVESVVNFALSMVIGLISYFLLSPLLLTKEITMKLEIIDLAVLFAAGMLLSFLAVFLTVKSMLREAPNSLMDYRI